MAVSVSSPGRAGRAQLRNVRFCVHATTTAGETRRDAPESRRRLARRHAGARVGGAEETAHLVAGGCGRGETQVAPSGSTGGVLADSGAVLQGKEDAEKEGR